MPLLPRYHRNQNVSTMDGRREHAREIVNDWDGSAGKGQHADPLRLRGIPVVGGCSGTSPGTDPYWAYARREGVAV